MNEEIDDGCVCDRGGSCTTEQALICHRKMLLRMDGPREMARQAARSEEDALEDARAEARRLVAAVLADPGRELFRVQLQRLLSHWPNQRTEVPNDSPIKKSIPTVGRGSRFVTRSGQVFEWEDAAAV
jgi:hypothetical protein